MSNGLSVSAFLLLCLVSTVRSAACPNNCVAPYRTNLLHTFGINLITNGQAPHKVCKCSGNHLGEILLKDPATNVTDFVLNPRYRINPAAACAKQSDLKLCLENGVCCYFKDNKFPLYVAFYTKCLDSGYKDCHTYAVFLNNEFRNSDIKLRCGDTDYRLNDQLLSGGVYSEAIGLAPTDVYPVVTSIACQGDPAPPLTQCSGFAEDRQLSCANTLAPGLLPLYMNGLSASIPYIGPQGTCSCDKDRTVFVNAPVTSNGVTLSSVPVLAVGQNYTCSNDSSIYFCNTATQLCCKLTSGSAAIVAPLCTSNLCAYRILLADQDDLGFLRCDDGVNFGQEKFYKFFEKPEKFAITDSIGCSRAQALGAKCP